MNGCENRNLIRPEMEVLLWAIRVDKQGEDRIRELITSDVDWSCLLEQAQLHKIVILLYDRVKNLPDNCITTDMDHKLHGLCRMINGSIFLNVRQLFRILQILSDQGIYAIPFKGVVLSQQVYRTPFVRQCGDIDVLIKFDQLPRLINAFQEIGFYPEILSTNKFVHSLICSIMKSIEFNSKQHIYIDVHWSMSDIFSGYPAKNEFLDNIRTIKLFDYNIPTFSPEDTLIMLSAHGVKHFWPNIRSLADIIHLLYNYSDLDISLALSRAEKLRCKRLLCISLHMADALGGIKYTSEIKALLDSDPVSRKIALDFIEYLTCARKPEPISRVFTMIRSREHTFDALRFALYALFSCTPPSGCNIRLPRPLRPLYIFIQIIWTIKKPELSLN